MKTKDELFNEMLQNLIKFDSMVTDKSIDVTAMDDNKEIQESFLDLFMDNKRLISEIGRLKNNL